MEKVTVCFSKEELELIEYGLTTAIYKNKDYLKLVSPDYFTDYVETRLREVESLEKLRLKLIRAEMGLGV